MGGEGVWAVDPASRALRDCIHGLAVVCPALIHGGLTWSQLRDLAKSWGRVAGIRVAIELRKGWPFGGSIQRFGGCLVIFIDAALDHFNRRHALAHEVGHLVLGHYDPDDDHPWYLSDSIGASQWEDEAQAFAALATRSPGLLLDWHLGQL